MSSNGDHSEDERSVISSSGSEEYLPKPQDLLDIDSDSADEMNFIGDQPSSILEASTMNMMNMAFGQQSPPPGAQQFAVAMAPIQAGGTHEQSGDILEFMSKQSRIIGSNMMDDSSLPLVISTENACSSGAEKPSVEQPVIDTSQTVHLGQEVLTKHSSLEANGVLYVVYGYRWVCKWQHISLTILASNNYPPLIPYKDLTTKVLADISSRALTTKVNKLGCQSVYLPEDHVQMLQQHDATFKKSSGKFMYLVDFVRVCKLYEIKIPESLEDLYSLHSLHTLNDIQCGKVASLTSETYQNQQAARVEQSMFVALDQGINMSTANFNPGTYIPSYQPAVFRSQGQFYSPETSSYANNYQQLTVTTASLPVAGHEMSPLVGIVPTTVQPLNVPQMPQASFDGRISRSHSSPMKPSSLAALQSSDSSNEMKYDARSLVTPSGQQITPLVRDDGCYLCANDIVAILPHFSRSFLEKKRGMRYLNANRLEIELLKQRGLVAKKACRAALYSAKTIVDMCYSSSIQPPSFLADLASGKYPEKTVTLDNLKAVMEHIRLSQQRSGDKAEASPEHKRSGSEKFLPEDNSLGNDVRLCSLPWGSVELHLLQPPEGEPYISITEISNKLLHIDAKRCQQRRQRMQMHSIHATVHQMQLLRSSGALKGAYCKLVKITDAVKLCKSFGLGVPDNVKAECQNYEEVPVVKQESDGDLTASINDISSQEEDGLLADNMSEGMDSETSQSGVGSFQHIKWDREGTKEIVIYTSTSGIHYCGLHELYSKILQSTVERFSLKTRMRKLGIRSIRAAPLVRLKLIELQSLPSHSPVCALILLSEAEHLVRSFHLPVPQLVYETFLRKPDSTSSTAADSLIVSIPKRTPTTELTIPSSPGKLVIDSSSASVKPSGLALQNMARKISRKNHKIAQQRQQGLFSQRRCPSCGHLTPSLKKRCLQCQSFLVGRACPSCNELNHNRSIFCSKCHTSLYPDKSGVNVKLGTIQMASSSSQATNMYYSSSQPSSSGLVLQPPIITQAPSVLAAAPIPMTIDGNTSPQSPKLQFTAPPIRAAALKTLFPTDIGGDKQSPIDVDSSKKLSNTQLRACPECSQPNPRTAKKCQKCHKPLQGKACPQCGRPNHSWVPSCYKCGASLPTYLGKTGKRHSGVRHIPTFYNNYVVVEQEESRVPVNACVRCYDVKLNGSFKCGRCGCTFKTKPANDTSSLPLEPPQSDLLEQTLLVDFGVRTLDLSSDEVLAKLQEVLAHCEDELHKVEESSKDVIEEYEEIHMKRLNTIDTLHNLQAELDSLVEHSTSLQHSLKKYKDKTEHYTQVIALYPDKIKAMEEKIHDKDDIVNSL
ncbi:uncharacterized protein [Dysidea avara]|uniref:uncharacterized protein isoform X2 n=1 Tax=Dysidea avara TaxID=196820 RepID=UPI00331F60BC